MIELRRFQHDNGYMNGRSLIKIHTDERAEVHIALSIPLWSPIQVLTGLDVT